MELRPRKGRSAQTPSSTPTPAKPSSRKPSNPSSRKKPTSLPPPPLVLFASADKGLHPKQIHVDLRCPSPAPNQTNHDNSLSAETPLSDFVKSRRKAVSLTAKKKNKALNNTFTEAGSDAEQDTTSMDEACTANDRNAIALEAVQLDDTATCDEIAAVKDSKGAEGTGDKTSIELVGEKLVRKDKKLQSAKKKSPTERRVEKTENGGLLGEVGKFKLDHVNDQDHSLVAAAPGMAASDECHHPLLLILSDDENAEVSGVMQTHVCEGKQGQDLKSSGKKKSRSSKENFNEENIIRNLFEENNAVVLSPSDREPAEHLEHGTCNVANPSNDDDTEMENGNTPEDTEMVNSTYESQCCKPCTEILKESLQSDTVMLVIDEANGLTPDEAVEGDEFGNEVNCNNVPEYSSQKSDAAEGGEDFGNEHAHSNVPEESSHRESKRDEELSNEHDDFPELKLNEAKGGSVHNSDDSNIDDDSGDSSGSDEEGDLASIFASSMKAHLHISEPSVLSKSKGMQSELNVRKGRESSLTKDVAKGSHVNGSRSVGSELSWLPKVALSTSKNHRPQAGLLKTRPNGIWEKDRGLQDGLCLPPVDPVKLNKLAKKQRKDTAGHQWYNLSAPTITPELKKELQLVKLRGVLDPKRHYKAEDSKGLPKYFQVGTVVGGPADFYSGRLTKKEQKGSLANELLSDSSLSTYRKRKYLEIQDKKQAGGKGFLKKTKRKRTPAWAKI